MYRKTKTREEEEGKEEHNRDLSELSFLLCFPSLIDYFVCLFLPSDLLDLSHSVLMSPMMFTRLPLSSAASDCSTCALSTRVAAAVASYSGTALPCRCM